MSKNPAIGTTGSKSKIIPNVASSLGSSSSSGGGGNSSSTTTVAVPKTTTPATSTTSLADTMRQNLINAGYSYDASGNLISPGSTSTTPSKLYTPATGNVYGGTESLPTQYKMNNVTGKYEPTGYVYSAPSDTSSSTSVRDTAVNNPTVPVDTTLTAAQYKAEITSNLPAKPEVQNYTDVYSQQRQALGITALEDNINSNEAEKADLVSQLDAFKRQEQSGQSASFAAGRVSTAQQNIQDKLDAINRTEAVTQNQLNTKNQYLQDYMSYTEKDYAAANADYQFEFNKALTMQSNFASTQNVAMDNTRASLTTISNLISNSGKTFADLSPAMKANINQMELTAGIPIGTFETFAASKPKADIVATQNGSDENGNEFISILSKDPATGVISQSKTYTGGVKTSSSYTSKNEANDVAESVMQIQDLIKSNGWKGVNPDQYNHYKQYLMDNYGAETVAKFDKALADAGLAVDYNP